MIINKTAVDTSNFKNKAYTRVFLSSFSKYQRYLVKFYHITCYIYFTSNNCFVSLELKNYKTIINKLCLSNINISTYSVLLIND